MIINITKTVQLKIKEHAGKDLTKQMKVIIQKVSLPSAWMNASINYFENEKMKSAQVESSFAQKLRDELVEIEMKLNRLLDLQLNGSLSQTEHTARK